MEELDLHGKTYSEAEILVEDFVLMHKPPVRIITGNSDKMKSVVRKVLDKHDYAYGTFAYNLGEIVVLGNRRNT